MKLPDDPQWRMVGGPYYEYIGEFYNGRIEGQGMLKTLHGDVYNGRFLKNGFDGKGKLETREGFHFDGTFYKGVPEGKANIRLPNGENIRRER